MQEYIRFIIINSVLLLIPLTFIYRWSKPTHFWKTVLLSLVAISAPALLLCLLSTESFVYIMGSWARYIAFISLSTWIGYGLMTKLSPFREEKRAKGMLYITLVCILFNSVQALVFLWALFFNFQMP